MALKTYLVRAKGACYYVAQVRAKSPKAAVLKAALEVESQYWYSEEDDGYISDLTDHEYIKPDETNVTFD